MNGNTAKLIRKVASIRGIKSPRKVRSLKRMYYNLNQEERELQKIQWRMEVDDFLAGIKSQYTNKTKEIKKVADIAKSKADTYKERYHNVFEDYKQFKEQLAEAPISKRLNYLLTGKMEGIS